MYNRESGVYELIAVIQEQGWKDEAGSLTIFPVQLDWARFVKAAKHVQKKFGQVHRIPGAKHDKMCS